MGGGANPGTVMGALFASAPGLRVSPATAERLGTQVPAGADVNRASRTITFTGKDVMLTVLASLSMPAESFRIAGMTDPAIIVPAGAHVSIQLVNADTDMAHGLVITAGASQSQMPMMNAVPAFTGSAVWFLGKPADAGMHAGTMTFTAATPGSYQYLCPVPGHARDGMAGAFTVGDRVAVPALARDQPPGPRPLRVAGQASGAARMESQRPGIQLADRDPTGRQHRRPAAPVHSAHVRVRASGLRRRTPVPVVRLPGA